MASYAVDMADWIPDVLGDEFEQQTLALGEDNEGEVVATLVRALPQRTFWQRLFEPSLPLADVDVLYVHGWSDYFFQKRLARFWTSRGARFYALDLRKYGRSLRKWQTTGYVTDLTTYDEDIAAALEVMGVDIETRMADSAAQRPRAASARRLIVMGHSTGGLTLSLWANRHSGVADAVVLNAPWLELQVPKFTRETIAPLVGLQAKHRPLDRAPQIDLGFYSRAQHEAEDPEDLMQPNLEWRPEVSWPVHAGWFNAILVGHATVDAGLHITEPVCVLLSTRTVLPTAWSDELVRADSVLHVDNVARAALKLGKSVTLERIDGALHDVFLSQHDARTDAYGRLEHWVTGWNAASR